MLVKSLDCFQKAIALEPSFAAARAGLADTHIFLGLHGFCLPADTYPKAEQAARKVVALDSSIPDGCVSMAMIQGGCGESGCQYEEYRCSAATLETNIDSHAPRTAIRDWIEIVGRWLVRRWKEPLGFLA